MKLRFKTAIFSVSIIVGALIALYASSQFVLMRSFLELEKQMVERNVRRTASILSDQLDALYTLVDDWAAWDDTYEFAADLNDAYVKTNLITQNLLDLRISMMLFFDSSGKLIFGKSVDSESGEELDLPEGLCESLRVQKTVLCSREEDTGVKGILTLRGKPALIVSRPILTSQTKGPVRGTLVMTRCLKPADEKRMFRVVLFPVSFCLYDNPDMPPDFKAVSMSLSGETSLLIRLLDKNTVAGYILVRDIYGKPAVIFRVSVPRDICREGRVSILYFVIFILIMGGLTLLTTLYLLEKNLISRLMRLGREVTAVAQSGDLSKRVSVVGKDELSSLAILINNMFGLLEQSREKLKESEERYRLSSDYIPMHLGAIDKSGKFILWNKYSEKMFGYTQTEVIGKMTPYDLFVLEEGRNNAVRTAMQRGVYDNEVNLRRKDGSTVLVHLVVVPHKDVNGEIIGLYGFAEDITERKEMETKLRERLDELERFQRITIGREKRIIELKEEVERLKKMIDAKQ
ncbi:MAG: CHASE4 domain-containing protein [Candidatus Omnitrophica bacterium]|nr:CHASE4 domain-containing protein [Candidatus Omnitrophota bacterium]